LKDNWIPLDARMIRHPEVGGTAGQLTANVLRWVLDKVSSPAEVNPTYIRALIKPLQQFDDTPLYPKRKKCTEDEVRAWILDAWETSDPPSSKTEALRRFRSSGLGFEQKRFGRVYQQLVQEAEL
jgi:hypothetical protein